MLAPGRAAGLTRLRHLARGRPIPPLSFGPSCGAPFQADCEHAQTSSPPVSPRTDAFPGETTPLHPTRKGSAVSLERISRLLEDFPISSRMGRARRLAGSRRVRIALNAVFVCGALAAAVLTILHFVSSGWP